MPKNNELQQNYLNPFNPKTKIAYNLPKAAIETIKVFDVLGREVEVLDNEEKSAGSYECVFNAIKLSSGIYFYQIKAESFIQTKKMLPFK